MVPGSHVCLLALWAFPTEVPVRGSYSLRTDRRVAPACLPATQSPLCRNVLGSVTSHRPCFNRLVGVPLALQESVLQSHKQQEADMVGMRNLLRSVDHTGFGDWKVKGELGSALYRENTLEGAH